MGNSLYQSYYTKSEPIVDYMTQVLDIKQSDSILEPCGGDGVFVDKLLSINNNADICIYELNPNAVMTLRDKYKKLNNVKIIHDDTLLSSEITNPKKLYDIIIGNPPYGAKNNSEKKESLSRLYPDMYIKESYTLFLYACINCLKEGGELSFIIPDTFLSLHRHLKIRQFLLRNTKIKEIALFPSCFFPGINFGYANLCILTLKRSSDVVANLENKFLIRRGFKSVESLGKCASVHIKTISQKEVYSNVGSSFSLESDDRINELVNGLLIPKIGDIANCVTGFYSGNDKKYLRPIRSDLKNAKRYKVITPQEIHKTKLSEQEIKFGIASTDCCVPIVKGGNRRYFKPDEWFMDWSRTALSEYRGSAKCRFQNPGYYFKDDGIAIPMIRSSRLTASLISGRLFDQSIVGVFPLDRSLTNYLLAFFNSDVCTRIICAINPSTNNSANYIKKIPYIIPTDYTVNKVDSIVSEILLRVKNQMDYSELDEELNTIFCDLYGIKI